MQTCGLIINNYATPYREDLFADLCAAAEGRAEMRFLYALKPEAKRLSIGWGGDDPAGGADKTIIYANDPSLGYGRSGHRMCVPFRTLVVLARSPAQVIVCTLSRDMTLVQMACWVTARLRGKRLLYWVGDVAEDGRPGIVRRAIDRMRLFVLRRADGFIFYSLKSKEWADAQGVQTGQAPYWIGGQVRSFPSRTVPRRRTAPVLRILFVGGRDPRKGLEGLLADLNAIAPQCARRVHVVLVGDTDRYRRRAGQIWLSSVGRVPANDMHRVYALCNMAVIASLREPWGFVFNEAILAQRPCIVSEHAGSATLAGVHHLSYCVGRPNTLLAAVRQAETMTPDALTAIAGILSVDHAAARLFTFLRETAAGGVLQLVDY